MLQDDAHEQLSIPFPILTVNAAPLARRDM